MNATIFLVIVSMANSALVLIMDGANVENVCVIPNGTLQVGIGMENRDFEFVKRLNSFSVYLFNNRLP